MRDLSIKVKLMIAVGIAVLLGIVLEVAISGYTVTKTTTSAFELQADDKAAAFADLLLDRAQTMQGYGVQMAQTADLAAAIASKNRAALAELFTAAYQGIHAAVPDIDTIEVTDAAGVILVRGHNPEKFGDDKSKTELFALALASKKPQLGMNVSTSTGKLSLDALVPVMHKGTFVGLIKVGSYPNDKTLVNMKRVLDVDLAVADDKGGKLIGVSLKGLEGQFTAVGSSMAKLTVGQNGYYAKKYPLMFNAKPVAGGSLMVLTEASQLSKTVSTVYIALAVAGLVVLVAILALVAVSMTVLLRPLQTMISVAGDLAHGDGDLTKRLAMDRNDELGEAARLIDSFIGKVQQSVLTAKGTATETAVASQELSHIAVNLSSTVQQQHDIVEESDALTQEVAKNLDVTEEMAINTTETIEATRDIMQRFVSDLNAAAGIIIGEAENQRELAGRMQQLSSNAGKIREVLEIISDIADQTNLLALNASIEAARAGEMGRGFAVVADEVRALAAKTQSSLSQINQSVNGVVAGVEELYRESEQSSQRMLTISESTKSLVSAADESGNRLTGAVSISSELVNKSTFIATRTKQLMEQMEKMTRIAEQNRYVAGEVEDVSASMARKSEDLRDTLGRFKC